MEGVNTMAQDIDKNAWLEEQKKIKSKLSFLLNESKIKPENEEDNSDNDKTDESEAFTKQIAPQ